MTPQVQAVVRVFVDLPDGTALYGKQIASKTGLLPGTLYPMLERLHRYGWLADEWEERGSGAKGRPVRRYYRLTEEGRAGATAAFERLRGQLLERSAEAEGTAVGVRVLTRLVDVEAFETALAAFLDGCPHVLGGHTFSVWPVADTTA